MADNRPCAKSDYIEREGKYERQDDELAHREIGEYAGVGRGRPALVLGSGGPA